VLGGIAARGVYHAVVVPGKVFKGAVDVGLVFAGAGYSTLEIIGYYGLGGPTKIVKAVAHAPDQVFAFLAHAGFHISILAAGQYGQEDFHRQLFTGIFIGDEELFAGKVN